MKQEQKFFTTELHGGTRSKDKKCVVSFSGILRTPLWSNRFGFSLAKVFVALIWVLALPVAVSAADIAKPRVAVFPVQGDGDQTLRERTAFSFRTKLDRTGKFDVVDGPRMQDLVTQNGATVTFKTSADEVRQLAKFVQADILVWGEFSGQSLKVKILDLRDAKGEVREIEKTVTEPTDLRFAVEEVLRNVHDVPEFAHPVEQAVWDDELAKKLWEKNPDLMVNGDFLKPGKWTGIYQLEWYAVKVQVDAPSIDKVAIVKGGDDQKQGNALVLNLSKECAENNGLACLSDSVKIEPNTRYRLSFRYKSEGPVLHVFVKGYTQYPSPTGVMMDREIYRRQVPPSGATGGKWVTVVDDLNPQHISLPVQMLRVDLYAYLTPGKVMFADVQLKAVGQQTRQGKDEAIKPMSPSTRPGK